MHLADWPGADDDGAMNVVEINIGPSAALAPVDSVPALAGKGLKGDRQFFEDGAHPGGALTLIEAEALEDVGLVGKTFKVGDVSASASSYASPACTCSS